MGLLLLAVAASMYFLHEARGSISISASAGEIRVESVPKLRRQRAENRLHCWRNSTVGDRANHIILISGCGYSGTGVFAEVLTSAGYQVGHEELKASGMSSWLAVSRMDSTDVRSFKHVFLLVRHPLKVVRSWQAEKWPFKFKDVRVSADSMLGNGSLAFDAMDGMIRALEWWITFSLLAENAAECRMRLEDIGPDLLEGICLRSELHGCTGKDWASLLHEAGTYNSHVKNKSAPAVTWQDLEQRAVSSDERQVLAHARRLCRRWYSTC